MTTPRVLLSWSTGKDAAWALHTLQTAGEVEVVALATTLNAAFDRVAMHSTRRTVLEAQASAVGLPLLPVSIPWPCSNDQYEAAFLGGLDEAKGLYGITHVAFGDLFLEDVRSYRDALMARSGLLPLYPIWGLNTRHLAGQMVQGGLKAVITCVNPAVLNSKFAGQEFDEKLISSFPEGCDPCGENGEFHSCVWDGPMFQGPLSITKGEVVERDGFVFADVLLQSEGGSE